MAEGQGNSENEESGPAPDSLNMSAPNGAVSIESMVEAYAQEYDNLDHTLDEIDSWMNKLEEQNDSLNAQLDELLESSRQTRKELQQQNESELMETDNLTDSSNSDSHKPKQTD